MLQLDFAGACFTSPMDFHAGTSILLTLPVPGEARMTLKAGVLWCQRKGMHAVVGCGFETVPSADLLRIERVLSACGKP